MRIGLDATALPPRLTGAGNYIVSLVRALLQVDSSNEYVVFTKPLHVPLFGRHARLDVVQASLASRFLRIGWEQIFLPALASRYSLDVLHSPHYTMPLFNSAPSVVTFHDMTFFLYPGQHELYKRIFFRVGIHLSARRARAIIADSESTRQDILRLLKLNPPRVVAVPLGVSPDFRRIDDRAALEAIRRKYHLPDQIILYVGVLEPRKNLPTLVRAFKSLVDRGIPHALVLVGRKGWMYTELFQVVERLGLRERVIFPGYVPDEELPLLYSAADLFVYPSLYEGFGLPVLEAMACGVPVVTSNVSSMPEIAGDAALLVDPRQVDELAGAMYRSVTDRALHDALGQKGQARAKLFSWERTARETIAVYERTATSS
jgi:glycosyltransferase involved in cell wall biosynthesis